MFHSTGVDELLPCTCMFVCVCVCHCVCVCVCVCVCGVCEHWCVQVHVYV